LAILNAGSVLGRILPNFVADTFGVYNMLIPCLLASAILMFGIFGLKSFAAIVIFGLLFGFTSGACTSHYNIVFIVLTCSADVSLIPSLLAQLSTHIGELGWVTSSLSLHHLFRCVSRIRMGIAFSVVGIAMLIGTPIEGALLGRTADRRIFIWWKAILFSGVCVDHPSSPTHANYNRFQIMVVTGSTLMLISRFLFIRQRGSGQLV
jgi:hypothetical protein